MKILHIIYSFTIVGEEYFLIDIFIICSAVEKFNLIIINIHYVIKFLIKIKKKIIVIKFKKKQN